MLQEVTIRNFALIDSARLALAPGLNILTGETGAGKSILIDAVEIALGGRASSDVIRTGTDRAVIEVVFDIMDNPDLRAKVAEMGLGDLEDPVLVVSREIPLDGRSTCRVNGRAITLSALREITQHLIDIHGQHEHQSLLRPERHVDLLDAFGGPEVARLRNEVRQAHLNWQQTLEEIRGLAGDERDRNRQLDLLSHQADEIERARLNPHEEGELLAERRLLAGAEKRYKASSKAYALLYEGEGAGTTSAHDALGRALEALQEAAGIDPDVAPMVDVVRQAAYQLDDVSRDVRRYRDEILFDPARLAEVEKRLDLISDLKRKYGSTLEEVIDYGRKVREELDRLSPTGSATAPSSWPSWRRRPPRSARVSTAWRHAFPSSAGRQPPAWRRPWRSPWATWR